MVCLTSCGSQGLPVYTVGAWGPGAGTLTVDSASKFSLPTPTRSFACSSSRGGCRPPKGRARQRERSTSSAPDDIQTTKVLMGPV